jgi:hypothetical protein
MMMGAWFWVTCKNCVSGTVLTRFKNTVCDDE